jgi:hypothetical protein
MGGGARFYSLCDAIIYSYATLFFCLPLVLLVILTIALYRLARGQEINFSLILLGMFFVLIPLAVLQTRNNDGYILMEVRYLYVFLPVLIAGLFSNKITHSRWLFVVISGLLIIFLSYANFSFKPFYTLYNNILLPNGFLISRTTWGTDTGETTKYINLNFKDITIYNPRGRMENLLDKDVTAVPWNENFWEKKPDYIIIEWEKSHRFSKIFDYYREHERAIWAINKNGALVTGIYKFNGNLNYNQILNN